MDMQMRFIQVWASCVNQVFQWCASTIERVGDEKAHELWLEKVEQTSLSDAELDKLSDGEQWAYWMVCTAQMYVDLMWGFGVFDDDKDD